MKLYLNTIPYWHNFTGPSRRGSYDLEPRTAFDSIAKVHDIAFRDLKASKVYFEAFISITQSIQNIKADYLFFKTLVYDLITLKYFKNQYKYCRLSNKTLLMTILDIIFETTIEFAILIECGIIILGINIILNSLNTITRKILRLS